MDDHDQDQNPNDQHQFRKIGSLVPKIGVLLKDWDSTPTLPQTTSETTGSNAEGQKQTGQPPTAIGAERPSIIRTIRLAQEAANNELMEKTIVALLLEYSNILSTRIENSKPLPEDPVVRIEIIPERRDAVRELLNISMEPGNHSRVGYALARVLSLTSRPAEAFEDGKLMTKIYMDELAKLPGDAVIAALNKWPENNKWWPSWHQLKHEVSNACSARRLGFNALDDGCAFLDHDRVRAAREASANAINIPNSQVNQCLRKPPNSGE